ncbi:MAG: fumarylacetoacetate hydrolase family protein [Saprospiraceae bacterium]|nr:fumarylacetoacetate hydrolase family protein [Saprospiraceae bacterium]
MGISIIKIRQSNTEKWGILFQNTIKVFKNQPTTLKELLTNTANYTNNENLGNESIDFNQAEILAPISSPVRVVCQGVNYASHRAESALDNTSKGNVMFGKDESSITGAFSDIMRPKNCECLDYEVELGIIIKKDILKPTQISADNQHEYIAGLVLANDMSPRDLQYKEDYAQWYKAKSCRTMLPLGPILYLLDKDDFKYLSNLNIQLWVNDALRQNANTSQLIFKPAETLTEISEFMNLNVGDLLLTGTPGGVVIKAPSKFLQGIGTWLLSNEKKVEILRKKKAGYLQDGDIIKARIFSDDNKIDLGTQINKIVPYGF